MVSIGKEIQYTKRHFLKIIAVVKETLWINSVNL